MHFKYHAFAAAGILLLFSSCTSTGKTTNDTESDSTAVVEHKQVVPLPHNSADIKFKVITVAEDSSGITCTGEVTGVEGYGAATPQIAPGSRAEIKFPADFSGREKLQEQQTISIRVSRYIPAGAEGYWSFVKFN